MCTNCRLGRRNQIRPAQERFREGCEMHKSRISKFDTLVHLDVAFKVGVLESFVPFSKCLSRINNFTQDCLDMVRHEDDGAILIFVTYRRSRLLGRSTAEYPHPNTPGEGR